MRTRGERFQFLHGAVQLQVQLAAVLMRAGELQRRIRDRRQQALQGWLGLWSTRNQPVDRSDNLIDGTRAHISKHLPHIRSHGAEIGFHHFRVACEAGSQLLVLRSDADRTGVEVALASHHATQGEQGGSAKAKLFGAQQRCDNYITGELQSTVDAQANPRAQPCFNQSGVGIPQSGLPGDAGVLDRGERRCARASIVAADGDYVGSGLGHAGCNNSYSRAGHQLDADARSRVHGAQVVNQLRQVLNAVNVMVRRGRNQRGSRYRMAEASDVGRDLDRRQLAAFAGLRPLRHFDFKLVGVYEVLGGDTKAARSDLFHTIVSFRVRGVDAGIFAAFSGIAARAQPVHGNRQRAMGFGRNCAQRHGLRAESAQDRCLGFDLIQRQRIGRCNVEQVPDRDRGPFFRQDRQGLVILGAGELDVAMHSPHELGRGGMTLAVVPETIQANIAKFSRGCAEAGSMEEQAVVQDLVRALAA